MVEIRDMPKLESPFEREDINGVYQCVPKLKEEYAWIFTDKCLAVDKLDGTNVSVVIQDNQIKNVYNRTTRIDLWKAKPWFFNGVRNAIETKNFNPDMLEDGQYFGELIGPKLQGNPYKLEEARWVPFKYLKENYAYKFWQGHVVPECQGKSVEEQFKIVEETFKELWSIYKRQRGIKGEVDESTPFEGTAAAEGIVFYNIETGAMCKLRRDMFAFYRGRRHADTNEVV